MIKASVRLALLRAGVSPEKVGDPRLALRLESMPEFIRQADLPLLEKLQLADAEADVPDDVLLEAKRRACATLEKKQQILDGRYGPDLGVKGSEKQHAEVQEMMKQSWAGV